MTQEEGAHGSEATQFTLAPSLSALPHGHPAPGPSAAAPGDGHSDTRGGLAEKAKAEGASERGSNVWTAGHLQATRVARARPGFLPRVGWSGHSGEAATSAVRVTVPSRGGTAVCSGLGVLGRPGGGDSPDPAHGTCLSGALLKPRLPSPSQEDVAEGILPGRSWGLSLSAFLPFPREAFAEGRGSPGDSGTSGGLLAQEPSFGWRMGRRSGNLGCLKLVLCLPSP